MIFYYFMFIHFLYMLNLHGTRPIVSLFADAQGYSALVVGTLFSAFAFLPMLLALWIGKWLDRYGARKIHLLGGSGVFVGLLAPVLFPGLAALFFSQIVIGLSQVFVMVSLQKTIGNLPGHRDKLIGTMTFVASAGMFAGPLVNSFVYEHYGFQMAYAVSLGFIAVALLAGLILRPEFWRRGGSQFSFSRENKNSTWELLGNKTLRKALIISGMVLYSKDLFSAYFPIYASGLGLTPSRIGILMSVMAGAGMLVRFFQYHLVLAFGRGPLLMFLLMASGAAYMVLPFVSSTMMLGVMSALLGAGLGLGQPLSLVYALNITQEERQGEVLGLRITVNRGSQFAAPLFFGAIGSFAGLLPLFWISGLFLFAGAYSARSASDEAGAIP